MTDTALPLLPQAVDKDSRVSSRPLILLAAAVKTTASPSTATVVRSPLLGDGSRLTVSFLEVDTATQHTAMPTLCLSVPITSPPRLSSLATRSQLSLQLAQSHARPTLLLPTKLTRSRPFPTTALVVKSKLSSKTSRPTVQSQARSQSTKISLPIAAVFTLTRLVPPSVATPLKSSAGASMWPAG